MPYFLTHADIIHTQKFKMIAQESGQPLLAVIAVWIAFLEEGYVGEPQGSVIDFDFEMADMLLELNEGDSQCIYDAMVDKGMIKEGMIAIRTLCSNGFRNEVV